MNESLDFDSRFGTDTAGEIAVELLDHSHEVATQATSYEATDPAVFRHMIGRLPIRHAEYGFVDLGSGKGRAVFLAAEYPFARIHGVEASTALHSIACRNARVWARAGNDGRRIVLRNEDAAVAAIPDQPCVVYLFNPFRERTVSRVLLNLKWSLQGHPRDVWVIYYNPQCGHMLERAPWLARVARERGFQQGDYAIWRSHGELSGSMGVGRRRRVVNANR